MKSACFAPYVSFTIWSSELARDAAKGVETVNALEVAIAKMRNSDAIAVKFVIMDVDVELVGCR